MRCRLDGSVDGDLTGGRVQGASALAGLLGGGTADYARRVGRRIENRGRTDARARRGSGRCRNVAPGLAVRRLRIAIHHAGGRRESKRSLKSQRRINHIRRRGLRQGHAGYRSRRDCYTENDPQASGNGCHSKSSAG